MGSEMCIRDRLRLFKLVFGSITLFPDNEPVLRPHLAAIVSQCMRYAASSKQSMHYYSLLRALFKSIGGGAHSPRTSIRMRRCLCKLQRGRLPIILSLAV